MTSAEKKYGSHEALSEEEENKAKKKQNNWNETKKWK